MKKLMMSSLLLTTINLAFISCKKQNVEIVDELNISNQTIDDFNKIVEESSIDKQDEKINKFMLKITFLLRELVLKGEFNPTIQNLCNNSQNKGIFKIESFIKMIELRSDINNNIIFELSTLINNTDLKYEWLDKSYLYEPYLNVWNFTEADFNLNPIISFSMGLESKYTNKNDAILCWELNQNDEIINFTLSEDEAMKLKNPLMIVDINQSNITDQNNTYDIRPNITSQEDERATIHTIDQYQINYRYDSDSKSEFNYALIYIYSSGGYSEGGYSEEIAKIDKSDIGSMFYNDYSIWQLQYFNNLKGFDFFTFEYDWYASKKNISVPYQYPRATSVRMKYSHQYYQRIYVPINQSYTTDNSKDL